MPQILEYYSSLAFAVFIDSAYQQDTIVSRMN